MAHERPSPCSGCCMGKKADHIWPNVTQPLSARPPQARRDATCQKKCRQRNGKEWEA